MGGRVLGAGMNAQLQFRNLTLGYDRHPAVHHLSGEIMDGALVAVVGPNGAGKSTLFKGVVGALKPLSGEISRAGVDPHEIAYLPQAAEIDRTFPINVYDMVSMGLWRKAGIFGGIGKDARMLFARLLLQDARIVVLDEPFTAIDTKSTLDLLDIVRRWHGEKRTVLAALHDIDLVKANFPETLLLAREKVAWGATAEVLTPENLTRARHMCEAFDEEAAACAA
jgi:zinc/manganese transport system ATP-binding protein